MFSVQRAPSRLSRNENPEGICRALAKMRCNQSFVTRFEGFTDCVVIPIQDKVLPMPRNG
jgi:hypothetical protein